MVVEHLASTTVATTVHLAAAAAAAASFSSLSVNHFSGQRQRSHCTEVRLQTIWENHQVCLLLVVTCHSNCSMLGLSFIIVIPHLDILHYRL